MPLAVLGKALVAGFMSVTFAEYHFLQSGPVITGWSCSNCGQGNPDIITWCDYCGTSR